MQQATRNHCSMYLTQAFLNERLVDLVKGRSKGKGYFYWSFICIYYSAVHYFNALLVYKKIPIPKQHKDSGQNVGRLTLAKNHLFTCSNSINHASVDDLEQLYSWSCDARYDPRKAALLNPATLEIAVNLLTGIKIIVFNELGIEPKPLLNNDVEITDVNGKQLMTRYKKFKKTLS